MLKIGPQWLGAIASDDPHDPRPFLLPGVRVRFAEIDRAGFRAARRANTEILGGAVENDRDALERAGDALSEILISRGIVEWEGVGGSDGDEPVPVTPENVTLFLAEPRRFAAADEAYVVPWIKADAEKNASAGSPSGTSPPATPGSDIASSPAVEKPADATHAPTVSTSSKPKRAKTSGK